MTLASKRILDPEFLDALEELARAKAESWWKDVLGHRDLVLAIRKNSINAYYRGASIFRIDWKAGHIAPVTHVKYLVRPTQDYIRLNSDGSFELNGVDPVAMHYNGPETLEAMLRASVRYSGAEKSGLHPMLVGNANVIDTEVALTRLGTAENSTEIEQVGAVGRKADRIDAAIAVSSNSGVPEIRFFEAKHFTNSALRAAGDADAKVIRQISDYEKTLTSHSKALSVRYLQTAQALLRFNEMRAAALGDGGMRNIAPALRKIADGDAPTINPRPCLIIYGFDKAQREDHIWRTHLAKLESKLPRRILAIGSPTQGTRFSRL